MSRSFLIFLLLLIAHASCTHSQKLFSTRSSSGAPAQVWGVQNNSELVNERTFDYIVVGGGLSGLTVAARLSEDPKLSVLVIEAGEDNRRNPEIYDIYNFGNANGSLVWEWETDLGKVIDG